jgi:hypothetical protein
MSDTEKGQSIQSRIMATHLVLLQPQLVLQNNRKYLHTMLSEEVLCGGVFYCSAALDVVAAAVGVLPLSHPATV